MDKHCEGLVVQVSAQEMSLADKTLFDAIEHAMLPTTAAELLVLQSGHRVRSIQFVGNESAHFHVLDARRSDSELPWILTRRRLYIEKGHGIRVQAFDIPHTLLNGASDLDAVVRSATSIRCSDKTYFFFNGASSCWIYVFDQSDLKLVAEVDGHLYTAARQGEHVYAAGARIEPNGEMMVGSPVIRNITTGRAFEQQGLDESFRRFVSSTAVEQLPPGYILERLHLDAFLGCRARADGSLLLVAGVSEAGLPQDLDFGLSLGRGSMPGFTDYVGVAYIALDNDELTLLKVDFQNLFMESVERDGHCDFYFVQNLRTRSPTLGCLRRQPHGALHLENLRFEGVDENTRFNKFRASFRHDYGYLALANIEWGFDGAVFSPEDYLFTSNDGVSWSFIGSTREVPRVAVPLAS